MNGSVSIYFPFLEDETVQVIKPIVDKADDFRDFVVRLVNESKNQSSTSEFFFFAFIHSQNYTDTWNELRIRSDESIVTKPFGLLRREGYLQQEDAQNFSEALHKAIDTQPDGWILFQLYSLAVWILGEPERSKFIKIVRDFIDSNPDYRCFLPQITVIEMYHLRSQGDIDGALEVCDEGLGIAREYDDLVYIVTILVAKGNMIKDFDIHKGLELMDEAYSLAESTTSRRDAIVSSALLMSLVYEALGEYDMALELVFESAKVYSNYSDTLPSLFTLIAARIYNTLEQPEQSLEWLKSYSDAFEFHNSQNYAEAAHAYILLGNLDQAEIFLIKAHPMAIKSGNEQEMMSYFFVRGLLDFGMGDSVSAQENIERSLELGDPQFQITVNDCLAALTKIEIAGISKDTDNLDAETSGPWMIRLRKHAYTKNYPGIKMRHALLKAEYQAKIGEHEAAKQTLSDALEITDSATVKTLRKRIISELKNLERVHIS